MTYTSIEHELENTMGQKQVYHHELLQKQKVLCHKILTSSKTDPEEDKQPEHKSSDGGMPAHQETVKLGRCQAFQIVP